MATYKQIQADIKESHGISVKSCWIAHVKELNGLKRRNAYNRHNPNERVYPCPDDKRAIIESSFKKFGMIK